MVGRRRAWTSATSTRRPPYSIAKLIVYHRGARCRAVFLAARAAACQDFREKLLDDASARMAALAIDMPSSPVTGYLLVEGAFNQLALHLLTAGVPLPRP